ncbi:MAG: FadR family transcriptional regulator [Burkholderiales bacterium]|nr:FadR family transcriptional regulator [Burkholderiales bacterium]
MSSGATAESIRVNSGRGAPTRVRRGTSLTQQLVDRLSARIRSGEIPVGSKLPTEAEIIAAHGVSRTVVREALSRLSAAGLTETHHGVGTFVRELGQGADFRIDPHLMSAMAEVLAVLELRISMETEAAALAAQRRSDHQLISMRKALDEFAGAVARGEGTVEHDFGFHLQIALATGNRYFSELMRYLGTMVIPRSRLNTAALAQLDRREYLLRVDREHHDIFDAIARADAEAARAAMRTHLANSRERLRRAHEAARDVA